MIANRITLNADPCHPYTPAYVGLYENVFTIGTKQRRMLTYIPEDTKSSTSGIYLFPPNGVTAEQFLTESNWIDIADGEEHREKLVLFVLEAADGGCWDTEEAYEAAGGEHEYVWQAFQTGMGRELCCVYEGKRYIVGYREGGTVAQKFAMWNPADIGRVPHGELLCDRAAFAVADNVTLAFVNTAQLTAHAGLESLPDVFMFAACGFVGFFGVPTTTVCGFEYEQHQLFAVFLAVSDVDPVAFGQELLGRHTIRRKKIDTGGGGLGVFWNVGEHATLFGADGKYVFIQADIGRRVRMTRVGV